MLSFPWGSERRVRGRQESLLVTILMYFFFYPLISQLFPGISLIFDLFVLIIFLSAAYTIINKKRRFFSALTLLILGILFHIMHFFDGGGFFELGAGFFILGFLVLVVCSLLQEVIAQTRVNFDVICGALNAFLLLGLVWGLIYLLIETAMPGSFNIPSAMLAGITSKTDYSGFFYFSYVTITTLGYGDITPISNMARSMAMLEAVIGQFYMVVLVARLVALHTREID